MNEYCTEHSNHQEMYISASFDLTYEIFTSAKEVMFLPDFVCLSVCLSVSQQDNSKSYGRIFLKF